MKFGKTNVVSNMKSSWKIIENRYDQIAKRVTFCTEFFSFISEIKLPWLKHILLSWPVTIENSMKYVSLVLTQNEGNRNSCTQFYMKKER